MIDVVSPQGIRAEAIVDLSAVRSNAQALLTAARRTNPAADLMAVVKADGYGHGAEQVARAALAGGATILGVATPGEALALRAKGIGAPLVSWLWVPDQDISAPVKAGVQLVVSSPDQLKAVVAAGAALAQDGSDRSVAIHLKVDTGLGRGGATPADFADLVELAARSQQAGEVEIVGLMSHLANGDVPSDESVAAQIAAFRQAAKTLEAVGIRPHWRHIANTGATLLHPDAIFDLVRCGIGLYGIDPVDPVDPVDPDHASVHGAELRAAMTLRARVALTKRVPAGHGVSYGLTYRTPQETTLALVPLGYADGVPRSASSIAEVLLGGRRRRIAGRVAMDQFVVDCGDDPVAPGDEVVLFGPGNRGEPTANDWARWCGTIGYEIVTRIGPRVPRRYLGELVSAGSIPAEPSEPNEPSEPSEPSEKTLHRNRSEGQEGSA